MKNFTDLGLAESLLRAVAAEGYDTPTPIQSEVIPRLLAGEDVIGLAQTGTGKTASFVLPLLHRIAADRQAPSARSVNALIVTPTRELASQIADEIRRYSRHSRVSLAVVVGGVKPGPQVRALSRGVDILVATPGRLLDHLSSGVVKLGSTRCVVLDEADQMLDLGFMPAIKRIMNAVPSQRQTVLMSATMPKEIRRLAEQFLTDPAEVSVAPVARPIEQIAQSVIYVDSAGKRDVLAGLLAAPEVSRAIVFTRTKHGADKVKRHLETAGLPAVAIHGNKSQGQRQRALEAFRSGEAPIMVATDIAARGIHVDDVSHVVNYELPEVAEVYVHRIGRTARAGRSGIAIALCDPAERPLLRSIERLTRMPLSGSGEAAASGRAGSEAGRGKKAAPASREAAGRAGDQARRGKKAAPAARETAERAGAPSRRRKRTRRPDEGKGSHGSPRQSGPARAAATDAS